MKTILQILVLVIMILTASLSLCETNPRWDSEITILPANPSDGNNVTFKANLKAAKGDVSDLKVIGGVDSVTIYEHVYPLLHKSEVIEVNFQWHATTGSHTVYFMIDPDETTEDVNRGDNRITKTFSVNSSSSSGHSLPKSTLTAIKFFPRLTGIRTFTRLTNVVVPTKVDLTISNIAYNTSTRRITFRVNNLNYSSVPFSCDPGCPYIRIEDRNNSSNKNEYVILQWASQREIFNEQGYVEEARYIPDGWSNSIKITVDPYNHIPEANDSNNSATIN
jgi:hypothetical protein